MLLIYKQQLVAKTNNKLIGHTLNGSFSSLLGLKQPSLSSSCLQECVNEGRGQRFGGMAKNFVRALCVRLAQHFPSSNPGHASGICALPHIGGLGHPHPILKRSPLLFVLYLTSFRYRIDASKNRIMLTVKKTASQMIQVRLFLK